MECSRPCYTEPTFDYMGMACYLEKNMKYSNTGMKVIIMIKDKNNGGYKYVEKKVMYVLPRDNSNTSTVIAYVAPGHDNKYNYMYLLSKKIVSSNSNVFSGDHFTMGLRNGQTFDLHYTSYDYNRNSKPTYIYYDLSVDEKTPNDITNIVCTTQMNKNMVDYNQKQRCDFFGNLMEYVHSQDRCVKDFASSYTANLMLPNMNGGKQKRGKKKQQGGDNDGDLIELEQIEEPFHSLARNLESKINEISNLLYVEMHMLTGNKGLLTYCLEKSNVNSMHVSNDNIKENDDTFNTHYSLPFNFETMAFISIDELVESITTVESDTKERWSVPLQNVVLCDEYLSYGSIQKMIGRNTPINKNCREYTRFNAKTIYSSRVPVSGGKKTKINKNKISYKQKTL